MARSRTSARPVAAGAVVLAALLSGCSATNPITTEVAYAASDGVRTTLGDLTAENLMLVAAAADEPGALQGALSNRGDEDLTVELGTTGGSERIRVEAGRTVLLGGSEGEDVVLPTPAPPGATADLTLSTAAAGETTVPVPVLDGTLPEYADLVPQPEPSATASPEPAPSASESAPATGVAGDEEASTTEDAEDAQG